MHTLNVDTTFIKGRITDEKGTYKLLFEAMMKKVSVLLKQSLRRVRKLTYQRDKEDSVITQTLVKQSDACLPYIDMTQSWIDTIDYNKTSKVIENHYFELKGVRYDSSNAKLDMKFGNNEREAADWLKDTFHDDVQLVPRPQNVNKKTLSSSDFIFKDEPWELKAIGGSGKDVIRDRVKAGKKQANNFLINITDKSNLTELEIMRQTKKLFTHFNTQYVDTVIVKKDTELLAILKRKR